MPDAMVNGVRLFYEEAGRGAPIVFVHEFAGDAGGWHPQMRFFAERYRAVAFNARGYPPSEVPEDPAAYSQALAADDIAGVLDHLALPSAHVCGLSMGAYAALHLGLRRPDRVRSLVLAGCGSGSSGDVERFRQDCEHVAKRLEEEGMEAVAAFYTRGPTRVQLLDKDPEGWRAFHEGFTRRSAAGLARTLRGVQMSRPTILDLAPDLERLEVPTLIIAGDEDDPCLEPSIFMKRTIPSAGLLIVPRSGHTINLEEPAVFNRAVQDFLAAVESGQWGRRNPMAGGGSALLPPDVRDRR